MRLLLFLLLVTPALAGLSHELPGEADTGSNVTVVLTVTDLVPGRKAVVSDLLPKGATLLEWNLSGGEIDEFIDGKELIWAFVATDTRATVTYTLEAPQEEQEWEFDAVYAALPDKIGRSTNSMSLITAEVVAPVVEKVVIPKTEAVEEQQPTSQRKLWPYAAAFIVLVVIGVSTYNKPLIKISEKEVERWLYREEPQPAVQQPVQEHHTPSEAHVLRREQTDVVIDPPVIASSIATAQSKEDIDRILRKT